jgi:uncharacterized protein (DUF2267 family)
MSRRSRVFIKRTRGLQKVDQVVAHASYVGRGSKTLGEHEKDAFFSRDSDKASRKEFIDRIKNHSSLQHHLSIKAQKLIFSLKELDYEEYKKTGKDFKDLVRETLGRYEKEHGVKLDWIANIHAVNDAKSHPHCHIIIKGVSDTKGERGYNRIQFTKEDFVNMKETFLQALEREVPRDPYEEIERMKQNMKDMSRAWEAVATVIEQEIKQNEFANQRDQLRMGKKKGKKKEKGRER